MVDSVLEVIGVNGGVVGGAMQHTCEECMQPKRYREERAAGLENNPLPFQAPPIDDQSDAGEDGSVTRAVVMDGKTLVHRVCNSSQISITNIPVLTK
jgi:hypothetical protein